MRLNISPKSFLFILFSVIIISGISSVHAHGLGNVESEILEYDDQYLRVNVKTNPDVMKIDTKEILFSISTIDDDTNQKLSDLEYHVTIISGDGNSILTEFDAYSPEDTFVAKIIPNLSDTVSITGTQNESGHFIGTPDDPVTMTGHLFNEGGLFQVHIDITSINSVPVSGETFDVMLTIGEYIPFNVTKDGKGFGLMFATYFDKITEFNFDESSGKLTAYMPFNWERNFVEIIPFVHAEYYIPKSLEIFDLHEITMSINDIELFGTIDRSSDDEIVVHFLIPTPKLLKYSDQMSSEHLDHIIFGIEPGKKRTIEKSDAHLESGEVEVRLTSQEDWKLYFWLEPKGGINPNSEIQMNLEFRDPVSGVMIRQNTYDIDIFLNGELVLSENNFTQSGADIIPITFSKPGAVIVRISNINDYDTIGEFVFQVNENTQSIIDIIVEIPQGTYVPGCESNDTCYVNSIQGVMLGDAVTWINSDTSAHTVTSGTPELGPDGKFNSGLIAPAQQFTYVSDTVGEFPYYCSLHPWMVGSITVTSGSASENPNVSIPNWVKNNAKWWSEGTISDNDFASGIEFMIKEGIIIVPVTVSGQKSDAVIPEWVKNNAAWWVDNKIDDQTFANGLQFLIITGIISV